MLMKTIYGEIIYCRCSNIVYDTCPRECAGYLPSLDENDIIINENIKAKCT